MSWTEERIERLKKMWHDGATASQIADELGGVSRNAVIGKAHRLGLEQRPSPVKPGEEKEKKTAHAAAAPKAAPKVEAAKPAPTVAAAAAAPSQPGASPARPAPKPSAADWVRQQKAEMKARYAQANGQAVPPAHPRQRPAWRQ